MIGNSETIRITVRYDSNALLLCDWLKKYSSPFEQLADGHPVRRRHNGSAKLKYVRYGVIQQPHASNDLFGILAIEHRGIKLNAAEWIPDFMREFHRHFTHCSEPFQPNPLFPFPLQLRRERLNPSLEFAV
jgi:hypothetical protein